MRGLRGGRKAMLLAGIAAAVAVAASLTAAGAVAQRGADHSLVVDTAMVIKTLDPAQVQEPTGAIILHQLYETLLTYRGSDTKTLVPALAQSYQVQNNARRFVFHLRPGVKFSDGTPLTSADVLYSLQRLKNIAAPNSFAMAGMNIHAPNASTVVFTTPTPNPAFPSIVTFEAMSIMNSKLLKANGGDISANAAKNDKATGYLNTHGIGTGAYTLTSIDPASQVVLTANQSYWRTKPYFTRVVLVNVPPVQQRLNVASGDAQLATDVSGHLLDGLPKDLTVRGSIPDRVFCLEMHVDPAASSITSNPNFRNAVRYALDYKGLVQIAGFPSQPLAAMIPTSSPGALPVKEGAQTDLAKARAELAKSGLSSPKLTLAYISITFQGFSFDTVAQKIKSDLARVGIDVTLQPMTSPAFITAHNDKKLAFDFFPQKALYADPSTWLVFAPGGSLALRIGYTTERGTKAVNAAAAAAVAEPDLSKRVGVFQAFERAMMASNPPYAPLFATSSVWIGKHGLTGLHPSVAGWKVDFVDLGET
jgi:peptide/nickel transport system substrate-binding protein